MYEYFIGEITAIETSYIVLEVNGIGYHLLVANPFAYEINTQTKVYLHQTITDTAHILYGFVDLAEKQLFELLIGVTGIGPKSALAILAASNHDGLINAIKTENITFLTKFPGVGKKTAQQIVIDLRGKLQKFQTTATAPLKQQTDLFENKTNNSSLDDAVSALEALGFSQRDVKKVLPQLENFDANSTDAYLRQGLNLLTK